MQNLEMTTLSKGSQLHRSYLAINAVGCILNRRREITQGMILEQFLCMGIHE